MLCVSKGASKVGVVAWLGKRSRWDVSSCIEEGGVQGGNEHGATFSLAPSSPSLLPSLPSLHLRAPGLRLSAVSTEAEAWH